MYSGTTLQYTGASASTNLPIFLINSYPYSGPDSNGIVDVTNQSTTLMLSGGITGPEVPGPGITKTGAGTLALSGNNHYFGPTVITGGTLSFNAVASLSGAGFMISNGATLRYAGSTDSTNFAIVLGSGGGAIDSSGSGPLTVSGLVSGAVVSRSPAPAPWSSHTAAIPMGA